MYIILYCIVLYICIITVKCLHGVHVLPTFGTLKCHHNILQNESEVFYSMLTMAS